MGSLRFLHILSYFLSSCSTLLGEKSNSGMANIFRCDLITEDVNKYFEIQKFGNKINFSKMKRTSESIKEMSISR